MMVSPGSSHALNEIARRAQELRAAFTPGASAAHGDVLRAPRSLFTLDPLSVAAPPDAFFIGRDERGRQTFTRDGVFHLHDTVLVDRFDQPVMGYAHAGAALAPLRMDAVDVALGRTNDLRIEADGSVSYGRVTIDPRNGTLEPARMTVGRLALARFSAATRLQSLDATRSFAPANVVPHTGVPGDGNFGAISPHQQEQSRIDLDVGIERLQEAYLAFDALRAAHSAEGHVEKTAMDLVK